jgi:hypothetical protein
MFRILCRAVELYRPAQRMRRPIVRGVAASAVCQTGLPEVIGDWRLEIGDWRLEIRDWRLEIGDCALRRPSFIVHRSSVVIRRPSFIVHRSSVVIRRPSWSSVGCRSSAVGGR